MDVYEIYGDDTLVQLQKQLSSLTDIAFYERHVTDAEETLTSIDSWADFRELPFMTTSDLIEDVETNPPTGSLSESGSMLSFTPAKDSQIPVVDSAYDIERIAEVHQQLLKRIGIEPGMRAMVTLGYHGFGTGYLLHQVLAEYGVEVIPAGPGEAESKAEMIDTYDVDLLWGNPSFALEIAEHGGHSLDIFIGGGEPFTSIQGRRKEVHQAFGDLDVAVDSYGLRQAWPVAMESAAENGMHVADEYMLVEIIDPETGELLPLGERGELVLTHLDRKAGPLVRYRTGDLTVLDEVSNPNLSEPTLSMPDGVFGRTDEMHKIKGVKVYPQGLPLALASFDGLNPVEYRLTISRPDNTDQLKVTVVGDAPEDELEKRLTEQLQIRPDEIVFVSELDDGPTVVDERY